MRKVAHIITDLDVGGAEKQLLLILPYLQKYFEIYVICCRSVGTIGKIIEKSGIKIIYLGAKSNLDVRVIWRMRQAIRQIRPDIIVTYLLFADILGRIIGKMAGIKKIICNERSSLPGRDYLRSLDKWTGSLVTTYVVQTQTFKRFLTKRLNVAENKFHVIPNAVLVKETRNNHRHGRGPAFGREKLQTRKALGFNQDDILVAYVGNLKKAKGHNVLLRAARLMTNNQLPMTNDIKLLMVGDGRLRRNLERKANKLGISNKVHFLGLRDDVQEILAASDIFVIPSLAEGMSNALLEAMAVGLPCIVSDIEVHREMIKDGENGLLFKTGNAKDLSKKILFLANHEEMRENIGLKAREYVKRHHDPSFVSNKWVHLINNVIAS